jgi:hypothetical protein
MLLLFFIFYFLFFISLDLLSSPTRRSIAAIPPCPARLPHADDTDTDASRGSPCIFRRVGGWSCWICRSAKIGTEVEGGVTLNLMNLIQIIIKPLIDRRKPNEYEYLLGHREYSQTYSLGETVSKPTTNIIITSFYSPTTVDDLCLFQHQSRCRWLRILIGLGILVGLDMGNGRHRRRTISTS